MTLSLVRVFPVTMMRWTRAGSRSFTIHSTRVKAMRPDTEIVLYGDDGSNAARFEHAIAGILDPAELAPILEAAGARATARVHRLDEGSSLGLDEAALAPKRLVRRRSDAPAAPVPAALPLLLAGMGALGVASRRKKRNAA